MIPDLTEIVDLSRLDRKLADLIESRLPEIDKRIELDGFAEVEICGQIFRVKRKQS